MAEAYIYYIYIYIYIYIYYRQIQHTSTEYVSNSQSLVLCNDIIQYCEEINYLNYYAIKS